jgi:hypothetical protein
MAHEQSETIQRPDGRWVNVYGAKTATPGKPLPPIYDFEQASYDTVAEAVAAAKKRSAEESKQEREEEAQQRRRLHRSLLYVPSASKRAQRDEPMEVEE